MVDLVRLGRWGVLMGVAGCSTMAFAQGAPLAVSIGADGSYAVTPAGSTDAVLRAGVAAQIGERWVRCAEYPHHAVKRSESTGFYGASQVWSVSCSGLAGQPDLAYTLRAYRERPVIDLEASVHNSTGATVQVRSLRTVDATEASSLRLDGPGAMERVLSDSFSEDRPAMQIHALGDAEQGMHRAVGSQLLYNRATKQTLFFGALTSDKFLTILRLHVSGDKASPMVSSFAVDSTGTTEEELANSLEHAAPEDRVPLQLPVAPGEALASETLEIGVGNSPQQQLLSYGERIRAMHHARVDAPPLLGWWSWTAYYFGLNDGAALTNAQWEAEHLKPYGYDVFHIDEGYQYARGEYTTANAPLFPEGMVPLERRVTGLGLVPGVWTAPFEVSERSWVFEHHPDWLIKNAAGKPIHAGYVVDSKDKLYMLDTTNPGAQQYLHDTYTTLAQQWGVRYIKMDFMDDSAIEGYYYKLHTTAMEAQRIGLKIIRDAVGDGVALDKDGSVMLNPVGYVDYGRISQDTGHSFGASKDAATGIAARFFMNRNYFVADPDAFTVSTQRITDQTWHEGKQALTLDEAKVSIALAAVSGGMLEIGDNLPSLQNSPDRVALLENRDLLDMVKLGNASVPLDLMSYSDADEQPSLFYLKESPRQTMLTVFDWTEHDTTHAISLKELALPDSGHYRVVDVLDGAASGANSGGKYSFDASGVLTMHAAPHTVHMLKIVNEDVPPAAAKVEIQGTAAVAAGVADALTAKPQGDGIVSYTWDFGDGVETNGLRTEHTWTEPGEYTVRLTALSVDGPKSVATFGVHVHGYIPSTFDPALFKRFTGK